MYNLRPYQSEARDAVLNEWEQERQHTLLVLPTGTGKTVVFSSVVQKRVQDGSRALILAHRGELLDQAADKLQAACGIESALEKAESTSLGSDLPVTVGSVQSLAQPRRLAKFPTDYFDTIVVDEAHHALSDSYKRVLDYFDAADVLGVTATPDRGDKRKLGAYFDSVAYEYPLPQAIKDGYLVPIRAQMIPLELDISEVGISNGDYAVGEIGNALDPYLDQIAAEMLNYCKGRKTVVFLPLIATSQKFCDLLNKVGLRACEVNGNSTDRAEILAAFEAGEFDVLCNSMLLTEGWDCPAVDCLVILRPTKVRSLYQQMVGRGMRLHPGKDHLLLLDFLWLSERHDLCRPSSLIAKDEDVAERINEQIENGGICDLMEAEEKATRDILAERETALAEQLAMMRNRKRKQVDPLQYAISIEDEDLVNYEPTFAWQMAPATQKQLALIEKFGISPELVMNAGHASMIIDRLIRRRNEGKATPKQIRLLERYGFRHVGSWSFDQAKRIIDRLAQLHWRMPYSFDAAAYVPV